MHHIIKATDTGKCWMLSFMWNPIYTNHPPKQLCRPSTPPMALALLGTIDRPAGQHVLPHHKNFSDPRSAADMGGQGLLCVKQRSGAFYGLKNILIV